MQKIITILGITDQKRLNLFLVSIIYGACWVIFHFSIIFFLGFILKSILLVGLYLGFGAFVAMMVDAPIGVLQRYYKTKNLLYFALVGMIISTLIFGKFIYFSSLGELIPSFMQTNNAGIQQIGTFFESTLNWLLILIVSTLYGIIKELLDVSFLSHILNSSKPHEYAQNISKYNVGFGTGSLVGMLLSGLVFMVSIKISIFLVFFAVFCFFLSINRFFSLRDEESFLPKIPDFSITGIEGKITGLKKYSIKTLSSHFMKEELKDTNYVFLKPLEIKKEFEWDEVMSEVKSVFRSISYVMSDKPRDKALLWTVMVLMFFGFWDTFILTFQVDFLEKVIMQNAGSQIVMNTRSFLSAYSLLGLFIIPIYLFQNYFIKKSHVSGVFQVISFGILLSAVSLICFGMSVNIFYIIIFGLLNSVGYAAAMPLAIANFSEKYNLEYAKKSNIKEINSNTSAAPFKILMNFVNIVALVFGGLAVSIIGFNAFFVLLGGMLLSFFVYSILHKDIIDSESE